VKKGASGFHIHSLTATWQGYWAVTIEKDVTLRTRKISL